MSRSRLSLLSAALAVAGLASGASAQIVFTSGSSYLEAFNSGSPPTALNIPTLSGPSGSSSVSHSTSGNPTLFGSAAFNHAVTTTSAGITGNTVANRSGTSTAITVAYGLGAPNAPPQGSTPGAPASYGYFTNFNLTQGGRFQLDIGWMPTTTSTTAGPTNYSYSDFIAYLWDASRNVAYALGGAQSSDGAFNFPPQLPDLTGLPGGGANAVEATFGRSFLTLQPGQYQLYLQSQSYVQGQSGTQGASTTASIRLTQAVPEPVSLVVFGGLAAVGGLGTLLRRRRKVTA